jgi:hypothetical protein
MRFEIHFEFRASLRKIQDLKFWDATHSDGGVDGVGDVGAPEVDGHEWHIVDLGMPWSSLAALLQNTWFTSSVFLYFVPFYKSNTLFSI